MITPSSDLQTIELEEYDTSEPIELSEDVLGTIDTEINRTRSRLDYEYTSDGSVRLQTSSYVGLVSLPDRTRIEIRPKAAGRNFLRLLLYAHGASPETIDSPVETLGGDMFLDALGALFLERLQQLVRHGLRKGYRTRQSREQYLRGRLDVQRQLSRGQIAPTRFDVEYQELTHDTVENQAVVYATHLLTQLVEDRTLQQSLHQLEEQFRREVTLRPVRVVELEGIHLDRMSRYYEDILRLAELVIRSTFVDNLQSGSRESYGILVNMNRVFEAAVERAARDAVRGTSLSVEAQFRLDPLVTGGNPTINMKPDFVVSGPNERIRLVGDAKWKTGRLTQSDIYQLTSYQLADDVPGLLVYPAQGGTVETEYRIDDRLPLHLRELPTDREAAGFESFTRGLSNALRREFARLGLEVE